MRELIRPQVVVSKCLGFARCRWNGQTIPDAFVDSLKEHVDYHPVCPEMEIGLGVPRDPIRIVDSGSGPRLVQPATGKDVSEKMRQFVQSHLESLRDIDGFMLKNRSPSCGMRGVKIYISEDRGSASTPGAGFFGGGVLKKFPGLATEEEGRARNFRLREHFLTKLFTLAEFRRMRASATMSDLVRFQAQNKFILMAYNQKELRTMGQIVANHERRPIDQVLVDYHDHLSRAMSRLSSQKSNINVLMHALGYFSKQVSAREKAFFLDALERYRAGKVPLSVPLNLISSWIARFENDYLEQQTFFSPYPEALMEISDSGKGRKL